jgi:hypothetical protein
VFGELAFAALLVLAGAPVLPRVGVAVTLVLWANLHGSYPVGLALLTGLLAGNLLDRRWAAARRVAGALALAVVAVALLNPHGPALFAHTWALAGHPNVQDFDEWKPVQWATPWGALFAGSLLLLTGTALVRAIRSRRWRLTGPQLVLMLGFGAQTYLHVRMVPWWVMLVPWFLLPRSDEPPGLPRRFGRTAAMKPAARLVAAGIVLVAFALSGVGHWWREGAPRPLAQAVHSGTPWELAEGLKAEAARGHWHGRVFASETQGDYLLWALPPEVPVTLYTHVHLFPRPTWLDALTVKRGEPGWAAVLDRLEVRLIVCEADLHPGLRQALLGAKDAWRIVRDEAGDPAKKDPKGRVLVAVRR